MTQIDLRGEGVDWIVRLPRSLPLPHGFAINGHDQARNIVLIGGAIERPLDFSPATLRMDDGEFKAYALRGFTGADSGTFVVQTAKSATGKYAGRVTAPIPWNAAPEDIRASIEEALGRGSVDVSGPRNPGGPWQFIPRDDRLGRVELLLSGLVGPVSATEAKNIYHQQPLAVQRWTGTCHIEGLSVGGPGCDEGMTVLNPNRGAVLQIANCHIAATISPFHDDHHHGDALQPYLGPSEMRVERTDFVSHGSQTLMAQPRETSWPRSLEGLSDWWFKDVLFEIWQTSALRTASYGPGNPIRMEDDWPASAGNDSGWDWRMESCFALRRLEDGQIDLSSTDEQNFEHRPHDPPDGLALRVAPPGGYFCDPATGACGVDYVSPGYAGEVIAPGTVRLIGESLA